MQINNIKINGFGKIKNKDIEFKDGINIVYGQNEAGKSTVLKFISSMFYGAAKTKNGKNISDFDKYKPWDGGEFSGKVSYELDNGEKFEVFREFKKKSPVVYNELGEDITSEFCINKSKQMEFFEEQTGIDEKLFLNTSLIEQQTVKLDKSDTNNIMQKISNLVSTGDDNISYKKTLDKINKMQNEAVGTSKTKQKPINIVEANIESLMKEKKALEEFRKSVKNNGDAKLKYEEKMQEEVNKKEFLKQVKSYLEDEKIRNAQIDVKRDFARKCQEDLEKVHEKIDAQSGMKSNKNGNFKIKICMALAILFGIISIVSFAVLKNIILVISCILAVLGVGIFQYKLKKDESNALKKVDQDLAKEYEIASQSYEASKYEVKRQEKLLEEEKKNLKKQLAETYKKTVNSKYIEDKFYMNSEELESELEKIENEINNIKFNVKVLENQKDDIDDKLEKLTKIEEELDEQLQIKEELKSLEVSFNLAKECFENAYEEIKHNISPKFQQKLCEVTSNITNEKYSNVTVNDETGLCVEVENGSYMPVDRLSIGTIDEMYLSLRLSILEEVSKEHLPIILDESFAYFDDERLKNMICYLQDNNYDNQIIIFTCSEREICALNDLKIEYNLIRLEK